MPAWKAILEKKSRRLLRRLRRVQTGPASNIGAFGGYKFGSVDLDLNLGGDWNFRPEDRNVVEAHAPGNLDASGAEAGGLIGYNYQFTNRWVVGLEAAGGYLWLRDSNESGI